jgi:hypothetical protein
MRCERNNIRVSVIHIPTPAHLMRRKRNWKLEKVIDLKLHKRITLWKTAKTSFWFERSTMNNDEIGLYFFAKRTRAIPLRRNKLAKNPDGSYKAH